MKRGGQLGFTLLEVLVATAIMGLTVAGVMSGLASATRNAARVTQYDRASMLARSKMDELLVDETLPRDHAVSGRFEGPQSGGVEAGWQAQLSTFESVVDNPGTGSWVVERIQLEIWWMDGATRRSFSLEGFRRNLLRPVAPQ